MAGQVEATAIGDGPGILILSSWVAAGHVGASAGAPALRALGRRVTLLPTVMLSNHPGFGAVAGQPVAVETLARFVDAVEANGWLAGHRAVLLGYMPTPDHAGFAAGLVARLRRAAPGVTIVLDPILGDLPGGLYLPEPVAGAVAERLVPLADIVTPNRFELGWLTGAGTATLADTLDAARDLRRLGGGARVDVTSPPFSAGETGVLVLDEAGARAYRSDMLDGVPKGTGDIYAALIAAGLPPGAALGHVAALARASRGAPHLRIAEAAAVWTRAPPIPAEPPPLPATEEPGPWPSTSS